MQAKESRGSWYIELVEKDKDSDQVIAQASAAMWYRNFSFVKKKLGDLIYDLLQDGTEVRVKCQVDFHERYGFKLVIEDIDPNFTFGKIELQRQEIINRLETEGLLELNKGLEFPDVIQRIAVISSETAAGYQDFYNQLAHNQYEYNYVIDLYHSAVQGTNVEQDTVEAIQSIKEADPPYHAAIIIRGGGSKLDLSGYDNYEIAKEIALSEVPFIIGIGHDIDSTVVDLVSCLSLKTPTAVADYLIEHNAQFETACMDISRMIGKYANMVIGQQHQRLSNYSEMLSSRVTRRIDQEAYQLETAEQKLQVLSKRTLVTSSHQLEKIELLLNAKDPESILKQGYSYATKKGKLVSSVEDVEVEDELALTFSDGSRLTKVIS